MHPIFERLTIDGAGETLAVLHARERSKAMDIALDVFQMQINLACFPWTSVGLEYCRLPAIAGHSGGIWHYNTDGDDPFAELLSYEEAAQCGVPGDIPIIEPYTERHMAALASVTTPRQFLEIVILGTTQVNK